MYTFLLQNGALWDMRQVHSGICEIGPLDQDINPPIPAGSGDDVGLFLTNGYSCYPIQMCLEAEIGPDDLHAVSLLCPQQE